MAKAPGPTDPNGPQNQPAPKSAPKGTNAQGYDPIHYGAQGDKVGYAKAGQARNQPDFVPQGQRDGVPNGPAGGTNPDGTPAPATTSYLTEQQQARVDKLLGDQYDPTKPLDIQLFQARWANATPEQRRNIAKNVSSQFLEGGPTSKTLAGFHSEYLGVLGELNSVKQQTLEDRLANYTQNGGGFAQTQAQADANLAHWQAFAATPEGQAHIAQTGMTVDEWLAGQAESMQAGADNYAQQQRQYQHIANLQQQLGITPTGMKPPGWDSTLAAIKSGQGPLPSPEFYAMYPGIAADLANVSPDLYQGPQGRHGGSTGGGVGTTASATPAGTEPSGMIYQPLFASDELASQYA